MGPRRFRLAVLSACVVTLMLAAGAPAAAAREAQSSGKASFIVTLRDGANPQAVADEYRKKTGAQVRHVYSAALNGFAASMSEAAASGLLRDRRVARVERDGIARATTVQSGATWGLDRLDTRDRLLDGKFEYFSTGAGVHAYVIDSGIRLSHAEFTGRISHGFDAVTAGGSADDCNGHGTHVAGTIGGTTYGVAKAATLHPVRVLNCEGSGTWSGVIAGVDWVTKNHVKPAVANMSLGGGASSSVDTAVRNSIAAGVTYAVAAGNDGKDACNYSPARVAEALTTGATDSRDARASWSNFGSCLNVFAPGVSITSAWHSTNTSTSTISGTSMASPHVAGVAAQYLALQPGAKPADVNAAIVSGATTGKVGSAGSGSPNRLLHSRFGETIAPAPEPEPEPEPEPDPVDTAPTPPAISLSASAYKVKGSKQVDLAWSGATSTNVDVYRDGSRITTTANDGAHTDKIGGKGGGNHTYRVCEAASTTCSADATVSF